MINSSMDLAPAPDMNESLKAPVVELNVVETGDTKAPAIEERVSPTHDDNDASDESGDEWESDSLYEEALHFIRDDQLSSGKSLHSLLPLVQV
jgi:NAD+-dependent protein deacetylase SIR2